MRPSQSTRRFGLYDMFNAMGNISHGDTEITEDKFAFLSLCSPCLRVRMPLVL